MAYVACSVTNYKNRMARKFTAIEENLLLASATLLDPRLKMLAFYDTAVADIEQPDPSLLRQHTMLLMMIQMIQ